MFERLFSASWIGKPAPPVDAIAWINSKPLSIEKLRGKVVLIDFWTYSCINCQRTLPFLKKMHEKYAKKGLVIIGVHSPEFAFEKDVDNVRSAVERYGIKYPVAVDSEYKTWKNYRNQWWPRKLLVDKNGVIVYDHIGEGAYEETEKKIVELLGLKKEVIAEETTFAPKKVTPEIYCGYLRNEGLGNGQVCLPGDVCGYVDVKFHKDNVIYLQGDWMQHDEYLEHAAKEGYLALKYTALELNAVMDAEKTAKAEILLNNKPLTKEVAGKDVILEGKRSFVIVTHPDLYNLVKGQHGTNEIKIVTGDKLKIFAFTFG